ncbi:y4mF family transcriptional regulator [Homoserinimonas aerilata]|uniref:Y4mF family transcriptional regulator n=1 Tax=Homoserinimonas aerilata TaxID=1162970 RepID=A0A542YA72_9MICO|nr:helix-turn-helix domain-containing protein [Homoserinimonas aerilata]TQL45006.1 y4mF family transcriptional regulator [Homoserinimonas aerilata]
MRVRAASDFGALVAERREALGLTQAELAGRAGVAREWLVRLENGKPTVTVHRLLRVLRELGLEVTVAAAEVDK